MAKQAHILVIDDDEQITQIMSLFLEDQYEVVAVNSGAEGIALLEKQTFDLIFCDLLMPKFNGMDFYEAVKRKDPMLATRIVFMSGGVSQPEIQTFLDTVRNFKLEKPFSLRTLLPLIESLIPPPSQPK